MGTTLVQQGNLHKRLEGQGLAKQLAAETRASKEGEARRDEVARHRRHLEAILAHISQMALDAQSAGGALSDVHSRTLETETVSCQRERRLSADSDASVVLRAEPRPVARDGTTQASPSQDNMVPLDEPNVCQSFLAASKAVTTDTGLEPGTPSTPGDGNEDEAAQLKRELEMHRLDFEREKCFQDLKRGEIRAQEQEWCTRALQALKRADHSEEQTMIEEQRLEDLVDKRKIEIHETNERQASCQAEVLRLEIERLDKAHHLRLERVDAEAAEQAASDEHARMWSKRQDIDDAISRLKAKRAAHLERS